MSKGQRHARQPVSRVKGRETSQPRHPGTGRDNGSGKSPAKSFIQPRQGGATPHPKGPRTSGPRAEGSDSRFEKRTPYGERDDSRQPGARRPQSGKRFEQQGSDSRFEKRTPYGERDDSRQPGGRRPQSGKRFEQQGSDSRFEKRTPYGERDDNRPAGRREASGADEGFGQRRQAPAPLVQKAKKLRLRSPSQKIQDKSKRLRETRVDLDEMEPIRLQKALAASGVGSRREMEEWIEAGLVTVNGKVATLGDRVGPRDRVMVKGDQIKLKWADRLPRVIMYHKQEGELVTRDDPQGRVTIFDRLPQAKSSRWVAIGRLDANTSGLLLLTTSGELANRMMHPSFEVEREYAVRILGEVSTDIMKAMTEGVELEDGPARFERIWHQQDNEESANHWYNVVIKEGRNREVRRMFEAFGLTVSRLIRVRFGKLGLPPRLKRGQFYELNEAEVAAVMKWCDLTMTGRQKRR